jgi:hypothetical protein
LFAIFAISIMFLCRFHKARELKVEKCQVNNISGTPELDINYSMRGEGGPLQEILISIDSKLKHGIHL